MPVTARGAGTSCAGNAIGPGVVIDYSRHLNRIIKIDPEKRYAIVEPGVVQAQLQQAAAPYGLRFGPDPSTSSRCTIGGMIGNNACGPHATAYGRTSDNVLELRLIDGLGREIIAGQTPQDVPEAPQDASVSDEQMAPPSRLSCLEPRAPWGLLPKQPCASFLFLKLPYWWR